ncbi:hypothetical protein [Photobacterium sp. R1]
MTDLLASLDSNTAFSLPDSSLTTGQTYFIQTAICVLPNGMSRINSESISVFSDARQTLFALRAQRVPRNAFSFSRAGRAGYKRSLRRQPKNSSMNFSLGLSMT